MGCPLKVAPDADVSKIPGHNERMATSSLLIRADRKTVQNALHALKVKGSIVWDGVFVRVIADGLRPDNLNDAWLMNLGSPLPSTAQELSQRTASLVLAQLNWNGEWLRLWAFQDGELAFQYDSNPSFVTCTVSSPDADAPGVLAELFGVPDNARAITQLLTRRRGLGFISETQRAEQLEVLLGVPRA
jgi:hypothetical protein